MLAICSVAAVSASVLRVKDDTCTCKNFKQTYSEGVPCGAANEYMFDSGESTLSKPRDRAKYEAKWGQMLCTEFFERLDTNRCVSSNMGSDMGTWCFVDPACKTLNMGGRVPEGNVAWKRCRAGQDPQLRDLSPEDLLQLSRDQDLWFAVLHKMSYPGNRAGESGGDLWKNVKESFGISVETGVWSRGYSPRGGMGGTIAARIRKAKAVPSPYFFDTNGNGTVPQVIVDNRDGYKVWLVEGDRVPGTSPGSWSRMRCIGAC